MTSPSASRPKFWRKAALRVSAFALVPYVFVAGMFIGFQRSLLYPALQTEPLPARAQAVDEGVRLEDVAARTNDGVTLHGWHGRPAGGKDDAERPVVLIFHGNGGNRIQSLALTEMFCELGADVLLFDYRGYGENGGEPSEEGLADDARAMWNYATRELDVPPGRVVLCGQSLGGGVAVALAAELCRQETPPAGLIVRSTFTSMVDAASHHYPWLPVRLALRDRYDSIGRIGEIDCPFLSLHGDADTVVPLEQGRRLFDAAAQRSASGVAKRFVVFPGAGHNDVLHVARDEYQTAIAGFLASLKTSPRP